MQPEASQRPFLRLRSTGQHRAQLCRRLEQLGGLAVNHRHITFFAGVGVMAVEQLHDLALGDGIGGIGQNFHDPHVADVDHHLERTGIQKVAHQHAGLIAPDGVGCFPSAAQIGFVHHVVVQQGGGVDELDDGGGVDVSVAGIAAGARRQQHGRRPQPFATAVDDIAGQLVDQHHVGMELPADQGVDGAHVVRDWRADLFDIHGER